MVKLEQRALVMMTQEQIDELAMAKKVNLLANYTKDYYIYQVSKQGEPEPFHGIDGDLEDATEPCIHATGHTEKMWEDYKAENPWIDNPNINKPGNQPSDDNNNDKPWWEDIWPFSGEGENE